MTAVVVRFLRLRSYNIVTVVYNMNVKIIDLHNDLPTVLSDRTEYQNNKKTGYRSIYALYKGERTLEEIKKCYDFAKQSGAEYFAFEDACYKNEEKFFELAEKVKPFYASLCWNYENDYASGCLSTGGLKKSGYKFVKRLNKLNIPLDLAHADRRTFFQALDVADKVLCSHTSFSFICDKKRNIDDEQIKAIIERKGIIGACFVGYFLGAKFGDYKEAKMAFYRRIDGFLQKYGNKNLCIGSDLFGSDFLAFSSYNEFFNEFCDCFLSGIGDMKSLEKILYKNALGFFGERRFDKTAR